MKETDTVQRAAPKIKTTIHVDEGLHQQTRHILLDRRETFSAWVEKKMAEEVRNANTRDGERLT